MSINKDFLPTNHDEMQARGWDCVDVVLVTGDAYVDHPSFGIAIIGRLLESQGYRVGILAQPRYDSPRDFTAFGRPRLFWGISAGNLDSIVANYTGNAKVRDKDDYSPDGNPYFGTKADKSQRRRPDRATLIYSNLARQAYKEVPIVLGGVEASLRRFVHYDYQQQKLRASILSDAKADLLVYGMGEKAILEIAERLTEGRDLSDIPGTCERLSPKIMGRKDYAAALDIPSFNEIIDGNERFLEAELIVDKHARALSKQILLQKQQAVWVVQHPSPPPLSPKELDEIYSLPFTYKTHPAFGKVPAYAMIKDSITIVRGCSGNCSFCAITRHQGPVVVSRETDSIVAEVWAHTQRDDFHGTISDLGGPTANLYGTSCTSPTGCKRHDCLYPKMCKYLQVDEEKFLHLLKAVQGVKGVKNIFISSGLRMELLLKTPRLLEAVILRHTPGALKIAPEHTVGEVLRLMHKPKSDVLKQFVDTCQELARKNKKELSLTPYFISAHPGCRQSDMDLLAHEVKNLGLAVRQFQDFTPTPGTLATAMYVSGLDRETKKPIFVAKNWKERQAQRRSLETMLHKEKFKGPVKRKKQAGRPRKKK